MQICSKCKKEIKYISLTCGDVVKCEPELIKAVTSNGRMVEVFKLHECKEERNETNKGKDLN